MKRKILAVMLAVLILLPAASVPARAAATMSASQSLIDVLKKMEGFSRYPYADNGQWTVGYGTRCPDDKLSEYKANGITEKEALALLDEQLSEFVDAVNDFTATHALNLEQHQFDALVSFTYNCGSAWMRELTGFFNAAVRDGDLGNALIYGLCLYSTAGGKYSLIDRRMCDANLYINGVYKAYNKDENPYPSTYRWVFLDGGAGTVRYKICGFDAALAQPIDVSFSRIPTGKDADGDPFAYTLAGWYTASGKKVEKLDSSLTRGQTLYAKWKDPSGKIVTPPEQTAPEEDFPLTGTVVNVTSTLRIRTGPGTNYSRNGTLSKGAKVTVLEETTGGSYSDSGVTYNTWCKLADDKWVGKYYVQYDGNPITGIKLLQKPTKTTYIQPVATVDPAGSVLLVTYANGYSQAMTVHRSMLSGFNGGKTGVQTVKISYSGKTTSFNVTVDPPGPDSITSSVYRISGQTIRGVAPGTTATKLLSGLNERSYVKIYSGTNQLSGTALVGTGAKATLMAGDRKKAEYTVIIRGDVSGDGKLTQADADLLMQYIAGWNVPVNPLAADVNGDGAVNGDDATVLLRHIAGWKVTIKQ